jgi:hypothetical protein
MDAKNLVIGIFVASIIALTGFAVTPISAQTQSNPTPPPPGPSCGWNNPQNASGIVASSRAGSTVVVTIGEPSWEEDCFSFPEPQGGVYAVSETSFPAYEVFPITVQAPPNTLVTLGAGTATPTAEQMSVDGVRNTTIWTWFYPGSVETDSSGAASSNLTLAGAVMPFVPNDISNVTLPIVALASTGVNGSAGLPIEFEGGSSGGVTILRSPGPIAFAAGIGGQAGSPSQPIFNVVYSPPNSTQTASPVQVSLQVIGTYQNGSVGPLPSGVQVSFPQPSFELQPDSMFYFVVNETNSLSPSNATSADTFTFAVQERVDNSTYVEPLTVSVGLRQTIFGGAFSSPVSAGGHPSSSMTEDALVLGDCGVNRNSCRRLGAA